MAEPDEHCGGMGIELDPEIGEPSLGAQCRNPVRDAHERRVTERAVDETGE